MRLQDLFLKNIRLIISLFRMTNETTYDTLTSELSSAMQEFFYYVQVHLANPLLASFDYSPSAVILFTSFSVKGIVQQYKVKGQCHNSHVYYAVYQYFNLSFIIHDSFINCLNEMRNCTLYIVHCTLCIVHCTLYIVHCTLYIVHCTLYIVH